MKTHIVIDGNAFYEIDEECMRHKMENEQKKIQKKNSRGTKKAVRRNEKIPEARFFAVFFNQSHVLQEKFRRRWYFFSQNGADV